MAKAQCFLVDSIHVVASQQLNESGIETPTFDAQLQDESLQALFQTAPSSEPVMVGIRSKTRITRELIAHIPKLWAIGAFCIGTDQIDLEAARDFGVPVFNAPFSNTRSVAELVLGEIIMLQRQVFVRSQAAHRGEWKKSATGSHEVRGKTLGIIGYGHIGSQLSVLAEGLGMKVLFFDVSTKLPLGNAASCSSLRDVLNKSDILSLHVPDTPQTRNMIDAQALASMKSGSYLINASRGQVVDLEALRAALQSKHIGGAAIDVFPQEPANNQEAFESPLRGLDNVILTPHIGGSTQEAQVNIGQEVSESLRRWIDEGCSADNLTLPRVDLGAMRPGRARLIHIHRNTPGAASAVNRLLAQSDFNIAAQQLDTHANLGVLAIDFEGPPLGAEAFADVLHKSAALPSNLRSRIIAPPPG